jgi:hypothetical protein
MMDMATIHLVILALVTLATTMIMMVTASNALRLRNVEISWKSGKLFGFPLFSTIFLAMTISLTVLVHTQQLYHLTVTMVCYNWIGLTWLVTSYLMSKRYVTDHGIVKNINDPSQTVAWNRIMDYVERNEGQKLRYVFFYPEHVPGQRSRSIRLELDIPAEKRPAFAHILQRKLGRRFSLGELESTGIEQLR